MDTTTIAFIASILALLAGVVFYRRVLAAPTSTERANEIAAAIATGASAADLDGIDAVASIAAVSIPSCPQNKSRPPVRKFVIGCPGVTTLNIRCIRLHPITGTILLYNSSLCKSSWETTNTSRCY